MFVIHVWLEILTQQLKEEEIEAIDGFRGGEGCADETEPLQAERGKFCRNDNKLFLSILLYVTVVDTNWVLSLYHFRICFSPYTFLFYLFLIK